MSDQGHSELTPEQRRRVDGVLAAALGVPPDERDTLVARRCGDDDRVLAEVLALLERVTAGERDTGEFLAEPAQVPAEPAGGILDRIGRYEILRVIGRGGMGTVYEARQDSPRRRVALKVINPGVASHELLRRFEVEAQILGKLQHPGIAQIFEAGTFDQGAGAQPFFAMEFVDGVPLVQYAREHDLGNSQRLELLARVCDAVQHAHQRGVIHRDLKPGNILVVDGDGARGAPAPVRPHPAASPPPSPGGRGGEQSKPPSLREGAGGGRIARGDRSEAAPALPKILDFGVARATDSDLQTSTLRTDIGQLIGTVPYMSPEQAAGDPDALDTRSDVYALGVIAYELLADRLPYDVQKKMIHEAVRVIREDDPTPLSSVNRTFRGDVEIIVGTALEKEKSRRYQSASDLASDIRRYLTDEPILARPPSMSYQLGKFARRNRALVSATAAILVVLIASLIVLSLALVTTQRARKAAVNAKEDESFQRSLAEQRQREAEIEARKAEAVSGFLNEMLLSADPESGTGRDLLVVDLLRPASQRLRTEFDEQPEVRFALWSTIAYAYDGLGFYQDAESELIELRDFCRQWRGELDRETLNAATRLANVLAKLQRDDEAEKLILETLDQQRRHLTHDDPYLIRAQAVLGTILLRQSRFSEAEEHLTAALDVARRTIGSTDLETLSVLIRVIELRMDQNQLHEAEQLAVEAVEAYRAAYGDRHPRTLIARSFHSGVLARLGRLEEASNARREVLEISREVLGEDHPDTLATLLMSGELFRQHGRLDEAEELLREAVRTCGRRHGQEYHLTLDSKHNLALMLKDRYLRYNQPDDLDEAGSLLEETVDTWHRKHGEDHIDALTSLGMLAEIRRYQQRDEEAEELYERSLALQRRVLPPDHRDRMIGLVNYGWFLLDVRGKVDKAQVLFEESLASHVRVLGENHFGTWIVRRDIALCQRARGEYEEAARTLLESFEWFRNNPNFGPTHQRTRESAGWLMQLYEQWGRPEEAERWRARLQGESVDGGSS